MPWFRVHQFRLACVLLLCVSGTAAAQSATDAMPSEGSFQSLAQSASAAREAGNTDVAAREFTRALALRPGWAEGWWELGTMQYVAGRNEDAVTSFKKLVGLAPNAGSGWSMLGLSEFETADYVDALTSLEKAQKLGGIDDPEIARVSAYHLALLLIRNGEFEHATTVLHSAFGDSLPPQARAALGLALLRVPLLLSEVDPSQEAVIQAAGAAAADPDPLPALDSLIRQYPQVPWLHYAYGLALGKAGHLQEAMAQQKLEAEISPTSALPWIEISSLALRLKEPQQALSAAKRAVELDAGSSAAHASLAKALAASGDAQRAAEETRAATHLSQAAPTRDPATITLYRASSAAAAPEGSTEWSATMENYAAGRYSETISALKDWVEHNPNDGTAWAVMGLSEFALKDYENARIHLHRGIDLGLKGSPESIQLANEQLALLLIRDGQFDPATTILTPFAGHPPMAEQTRLALGLALLRIPSLPDNLNAQRRDLAQAAGAIVELLLASHYTEAFPAFQKLIAEYPSTPWLHYAYGGALDSFSQYDDARAQMQDELKLSPHSALPWIRLASIAVQQHLPADAVKAAQAAVALAPDSAEAHYELGRAWLESGDAEKAIVELEKANNIKPEIPEIHFALARAYAKANQPEKAAAERGEFMQLKALASQKAQSDGQNGAIPKTNQQ